MSDTSIIIDREKFLKEVHELDSLQPPPESAIRLIQLCQDPASGTDEIMSIIECQPAIAARVLAVANSPLYGYTRQIGSINHAVVILGIKNITRLAVSFSAGDIYNSGSANAELAKKLYRHSLACALIARSLAELQGTCDPDETFLGGLLHDIGKLAIMQLIPFEYSALEQSGIAARLSELEHELLGISHEKIGSICARRWGLPVVIADVIANHHGSDGVLVASPMSRIVEAADWLAHCEGIGGGTCCLDSASLYENPVIKHLTDERRHMIIEASLAEFAILDSAC